LKYLSIFTGLLLLLGGCVSKEPAAVTHKVPSVCNYYSLKSAQCLDQKGFIDTVEPYKVIFVGDHHNSANAHKVVTELIDGLSGRGYKIALANEWFTPEDNELLDRYVRGELDANGTKALDWKKRVGYDFNLSRTIYERVIENGGDLYGINMSRSFKKMISEQNLTAMSREERVFYAGLDLNSSAHQAMLSPFFSHCHHRKNGESQAQCRERMYRVQVAWDTMMGLESAKLLETLDADTKLIVFVGAMHLKNGLGVNMRFARVSNVPSITVLPYRKMPEEKVFEIGLGCADLVYLYDM
jgi:uncharacterized iron-regulated protein